MLEGIDVGQIPRPFCGPLIANQRVAADVRHAPRSERPIHLVAADLRPVHTTDGARYANLHGTPISITRRLSTTASAVRHIAGEPTASSAFSSLAALSRVGLTRTFRSPVN